MTRKKFLRRLYLALLLRLSPGGARDVAADYNGFFADRLGEGKTEEEICREFGKPGEVARAIAREEGKTAKPLGVLAPVFGLLGLWVARFAYLPFANIYLNMGTNPKFLGTIILLWVPLLWIFWRKAVYPALTPKRGAFAALCVIPLPLWAAFWGFVCYGMDKPLEFWTSLMRTEDGGEIFKVSTVGQFVSMLGDLCELMIAVVFLLCVLWAWGKTPWYLVPAAHALGTFAAVERIMCMLHSMNIDYSISEAASAMLCYPLRTYLVLGLGGTALTAFLVWKGGRRGRAA